MKKILAFETSCDDTAVAIVDEAGVVYGEAIFSQLLEHAPFLGVVPEVGSRAHIRQILRVTKEVFAQAQLKKGDIDAVAATFAPGLLGPLLVGAQFAKGFAQGQSVPLIAVHHIEGHIFAGHKSDGFLDPPFLALIASGGHTSLYFCDSQFAIRTVGTTLDDAAGEAFDKIGRALGLGYPAGKAIDELASQGDEERFSFPVALQHSDGFDFSFSGLKTRVLDTIRQLVPVDHSMLADICASVQKAIAKALCERAIKAARSLGISSIVTGGGVLANSRIRAMLAQRCGENHIELYLPKPSHCTDNAVMIAKAAHIKLAHGKVSSCGIDVFANLPVEQADRLTNISS